MQRTLLIIKPDVVKRHLIGKVLSLIEERFCIVGIRMKKLSKDEAREFYRVHKGKEFYDRLVEFMSSGPSVGVLLEGEDIIEKVREFIGSTDPKKAKEGTIRNLFGTDITQNAVHASDSPESANYEIPFYFPDLE